MPIFLFSFSMGQQQQRREGRSKEGRKEGRKEGALPHTACLASPIPALADRPKTYWTGLA
jgi:hypothetical protein